MLSHYVAPALLLNIYFSMPLTLGFPRQYGPVFSFTMAGSTFTYLLGSDAAALMFNSKNDDLNAEDVYSRLTTPVFGKGVAYDVPNPVSSLQRLHLDQRISTAEI